MRIGVFLGLAVTMQLALSTLASADTTTEKWVCLKEHKPVSVKGTSDKAKQSACEKQGGLWQKAEAEAVPVEEKQSSGGGGGW